MGQNKMKTECRNYLRVRFGLVGPSSLRLGYPSPEGREKMHWVNETDLPVAFNDPCCPERPTPETEDRVVNAEIGRLLDLGCISVEILWKSYIRKWERIPDVPS